MNNLTEADWYIICNTLRSECRHFIDEYAEKYNVWMSSAPGVTANKLRDMSIEIGRIADILEKIDPIIMETKKMENKK